MPCLQTLDCRVQTALESVAYAFCHVSSFSRSCSFDCCFSEKERRLLLIILTSVSKRFVENAIPRLLESKVVTDRILCHIARTGGKGGFNAERENLFLIVSVA